MSLDINIELHTEQTKQVEAVPDKGEDRVKSKGADQREPEDTMTTSRRTPRGQIDLTGSLRRSKSKVH